MSGGVGIFTDAGAYLPSTDFVGAERVHIHPLTIVWEGVEYLLPNQSLIAKLPPTLIHRSPPRLVMPTRRELKTRFQTLAARYDALLVLPTESTLTPLFARLLGLAEELAGSFPIYVMDTHAFGVGLGWLVRQAAYLAASGKGLFEILSDLRPIRDRIYSMFCVESLTYLHHTGVLDPAQAIVGEAIQLCPLFLVEEGRFVPTQKARSTRHMLDLMEEFVEEFGEVQEMAIVYNAEWFGKEARHLQDRLRALYPLARLQMAEMDSLSTTLLGPRAMGVFVFEKSG